MKFPQTILRQWPLHLFLLPLFFILHMQLQYAGLLDKSEVVKALLKISSGIAVFFLLCRLILKSSAKAAIVSTVYGALFLFFGDIKNTFSGIPVLDFFSHYKTFVPLVLLALIIVLYLTKKSTRQSKTTLFLNLLFIAYFLIDVYRLAFPQKEKLVAGPAQLNKPPNHTTSLPGIYYIILDAYPGKGYQQEMLNVKTDYLDSCLSAKGFYVTEEPRSNYSHTAFSIASTLNMNYLSGIDTIYKPAAYHYNIAMRAVKKSPLTSFLKENGYKIYNLSIFDLAEHPAAAKEKFLSISSQQILFYNTALSCFIRDFMWQITGAEKKQKNELKQRQDFFEPQRAYNNMLLDSLKKFSPGQAPFFTYIHLKMPHFPYFCDEAGKPYPPELVYGDSMISDRKRFAAYTSYTGKRAEEFISRFMERSGGKDIIIVQSDHGIPDMDWSRKQDAFRNFSAFYFPDRDYSLLYSRMSNVNTFRVILNKYFGQQLPLLPDKTFYIK